MLLVYNLVIRIYYAAVWIVAGWNGKAREWVEGRKSVFVVLQKNIKSGDKIIWFHCSSAGEFEQGKPVMEALKQSYQGYKLLVTFFSPSGYNVASNYTPADVIAYLPLDTRKNAERFLLAVNPAIAVFVKYEFWHHHLHTLAVRKVPTLLISAVFREEQVFFQWYGGFFRKMLLCFTQIFVQDEFSKIYLNKAGVTKVTIAGDTRFDRVAQITESFEELPQIEQFIGAAPCMVAGSTWSGDEDILSAVWKSPATQGLKLIIAPHQINPAHIEEIANRFVISVLYSNLIAGKISADARVLIIDNVGMLSRLYRYATITYVGGGFTKDGIHNILEAAVWAKPVIFGPNHKKYREADELLSTQGGMSIASAQQLKKLVEDLLSKEGLRQATGTKAKAYIERKRGATRKVLDYIHENRLLTRL